MIPPSGQCRHTSLRRIQLNSNPPPQYSCLARSNERTTNSSKRERERTLIEHDRERSRAFVSDLSSISFDVALETKDPITTCRSQPMLDKGASNFRETSLRSIADARSRFRPRYARYREKVVQTERRHASSRRSVGLTG